MPRRSPLRLVLLFALALSAAVGALGLAAPDAPAIPVRLAALTETALTDEQRAAEADARAALAAWLDKEEDAFRAVPELTTREQRLLRRSQNAAHVAAARRLGADPVATRDDLRAADLDTRPLDAASPYYATRWGRGHLTPDALAALDAIGEAFHARLADAGLPLYRYVVSSTFRTAEDQARLRRTNGNAARGTSSHEFGTTFDIAYRRYRFLGPSVDPTNPDAEARPAIPAEIPAWRRAQLTREFDRAEAAWAERMATRYATRLEAEMGRALIALESDGTLLALREVRQPCFHVTVARRLA